VDVRVIVTENQATNFALAATVIRTLQRGGEGHYRVVQARSGGSTYEVRVHRMQRVLAHRGDSAVLSY
jgi:hypothetical protein